MDRKLFELKYKELLLRTLAVTAPRSMHTHTYLYIWNVCRKKALDIYICISRSGGVCIGQGCYVCIVFTYYKRLYGCMNVCICTVGIHLNVSQKKSSSTLYTLSFVHYLYKKDTKRYTLLLGHTLLDCV